MLSITTLKLSNTTDQVLHVRVHAGQTTAAERGLPGALHLPDPLQHLPGHGETLPLPALLLRLDERGGSMMMVVVVVVVVGGRRRGGSGDGRSGSIR